MSRLYVDTSAVVKLIRPEAETLAFRRFLDERGFGELVYSELLLTELRRAALRLGPGARAIADTLLEGVDLRRVSSSVLHSAGLLPPPRLRSLDAIHLATALELGGELDALVTYDQRLSDAAAGHGLPVVAPPAQRP